MGTKLMRTKLLQRALNIAQHNLSAIESRSFCMRLFDRHPSSQSLHGFNDSVIRHSPATYLLLTVCLALVVSLQSAPVRAESNEASAVHVGFGLEYAVPNGPRNLVEEGSGRIWYTATDAGGIGFLEVISDTGVISDTINPVVRYRTEFYGLGASSQPYDLVYDNGIVWFTLRGVRSLGKIDTATRAIEVFPLLSVGAAPTGIDVDPSGQLWLAQSNGRVSRFDPATESFTEFLLPDTLIQMPRMEDVVYQDTRNIWFTMPDANRVVVYDSVRDRFSGISTGELGPTNLALDSGGRPWITANGSNRVGRFTPTTVSVWSWYDTTTTDGGPAGLLVFDDEAGVRNVWVAENRTGTIARLQIANGFTLTNRERLVPADPAGNTWGIIRTSDEHIWVADAGRNVLYELTAPYIQRVYAASVYK